MTRDATGTAGRPWALALILGLFLALAFLYGLNTPLYETPDELEHAAFVVWLADGRGLPVVDPENPGPWRQEGTQPPLYYWLTARLVGAAPHAEADSLARLNPYAGIGDPQRPDNKNRVLHDLEQERWSFRGDALFVHLARVVSILMAAGTLLGIYALGRIVFPERPGLALGMMGLVAFMPQFLFLSASINNDNLVVLIAAWVLVLLADWLRDFRLPGWLPLAGLGILLGLASLAKFGGLLLWPLAAGVLAWLAWRQKRPPWLVPAGLLVFGLALALSGWWFVRNQQLYGDLSAFGPHLAIMESRRRLPSMINALREFKGFRYSFWGLFGWFNILLPDPFYWIMDGLTGLGIVGFGLFLARSFRHRPAWTRQALVMLAAWLLLVIVGVVRWTLMTPASQGRLLYPALPAIALFLVVGWAELLPRRIRKLVGIGALAVWALWAALCPFLFIRPAYALPPRAATLEALDIQPVELHVTYQDCCELVGFVPPPEPAYPGERALLTLVWRAPEAPGQEYALFVHATSVDGQIVGQLDTYPGGGMYPTSQWRPGEYILDTVYVPLSLKAEAPTLVRFNVGFHRANAQEQLAAIAQDGRALGAVFAGEAAVVPFAWPQPPAGPVPDAVFGDEIRLAGLELSGVQASPGETVTVTLQWEALEDIAQDYVGFVHLVDLEGNDVAQDDHLPLNGRFPTRVWPAGAVISDAYRLALADDLEAGTYELWGGFYSPVSGPDSGQRLPAVSQKDGQPWKDDLVFLGTLIISGE